MKWVAEMDGRRFVIENAEAVGFYLFVWDHERCIADHLQDSLAMAVAQAQDEYGVPSETWRPLDRPDTTE